MASRPSLPEIEVVSEPTDPALDGLSNAEILCVGIAAPGTVRVLVGAELGWVAYQVAAQVFGGTSEIGGAFALFASGGGGRICCTDPRRSRSVFSESLAARFVRSVSG